MKKKYSVFTITILGLSLAGVANTMDVPQQGADLLARHDGFGRHTLMAPDDNDPNLGLSFGDASRLRMSQSYSMSFSSGSAGSLSSGLYLNTISYQIAAPLSFSMDFGVHTPFHASGAIGQSLASMGVTDKASFVLPRVGLEYRPSRNLSFQVNYFQGNDAAAAYGRHGMPGNFPLSRTQP